MKRFLSLFSNRKRYRLPRLDGRERQVSSQFGEDGIIAAIFEIIPPRSRYFVEFGIGPKHLAQYDSGIEGNCVELKRQGWRGLMMDSGDHPAPFEIMKEFVTPFNVNSIFEKYDVPKDLDIVSIDVNGQDWWIWKELSYSPTLMIVEYNGRKSISESVTVPLDPNFKWDSASDYFGGSLLAFDKLARHKDYTLVFANGVNAFFVQTSLISNADQFRYEELYKPFFMWPPDPHNRPLVQI